VEIPVPETVVEEELKARRQNVEQQLAQAGMSMEDYLDSEEQTVDEFENDLLKRVRDAVAAQFLLDEVAKSEEIGIEQQELTEHMLRRAQQSGQNPNEYVKHMLEHNHVPELVSEVVRGKALALLVEQAVVTDASGNPVELKDLRPDGTIGGPEDEDAAGEGAQASTVTFEGDTFFAAGDAGDAAVDAEVDTGSDAGVDTGSDAGPAQQS
jgi:trigger factor